MPLPSSIPFVSLFQYSPRGTTPLSRFSRQFTYAIKQDGYVNVPSSQGRSRRTHAITQVGDSIASRLTTIDFISDCFGPDTTLVPVPRSSPLVKGGLWPTHRICQEMVAKGLAANILPCIERRNPLTRSSSAGPGQRPSPRDHYNSCTVVHSPILPSPTKITLVDDVVTRGSTLLGLYALLKDAFPNTKIRCFAAVRTHSSGEIDTLADPACGMIDYQQGFPSRRP